MRFDPNRLFAALRDALAAATYVTAWTMPTLLAPAAPGKGLS
jgi:hypothetical protein